MSTACQRESIPEEHEGVRRRVGEQRGTEDGEGNGNHLQAYSKDAVGNDDSSSFATDGDSRREAEEVVGEDHYICRYHSHS
jgi:hypothetical protein